VEQQLSQHPQTILYKDNRDEETSKADSTGQTLLQMDDYCIETLSRSSTMTN